MNPMNNPLGMQRMQGMQPMAKVPQQMRPMLQQQFRPAVLQGRLPTGAPLPPAPKGPPKPVNQTLATLSQSAPLPPPITAETKPRHLAKGGKIFDATTFVDHKAAYRAALSSGNVFFKDAAGKFHVVNPKDLGEAMGLSEKTVRMLAHVGRLEPVVAKFIQYSQVIDGFASGAKKLTHKVSGHELQMRPQELMKTVAHATIAMATSGRTQVEVKATTGGKEHDYKVMLTRGGGVEVVRKVADIAAGAFGSVQEGRVMWSGARVAMKSSKQGARALKALQSEAKVGFEMHRRLRQQGLSSRGLVGPPFKAQDLGNPSGFPVLFSRLAEGDGSLVGTEERFQETGARLNVMHQLFGGQAKLDQIGIANLDIKLENVLVSGHNVRLADFGDVLTREEFNAGQGSFTYSPSLISKKDVEACKTSYDARGKVAVFLLATTFYQMLAGKDDYPFHKENGRPKERSGKDTMMSTRAREQLEAKGIPKPVIALLSKCMHPDLNQRPSAAEVQQALEQHCEGRALGEYWKRHQ